MRISLPIAGRLTQPCSRDVLSAFPVGVLIQTGTNALFVHCQRKKPPKKRADIHEAFMYLGCALICWNVLKAGGWFDESGLAK
jgi:hypothetical protein